MELKSFKNIYGETLTDIGAGRIRLTRTGPFHKIVLRLWERDATSQTNSIFKVKVLLEDKNQGYNEREIGWVHLSAVGLQALLEAHKRQVESGSVLIDSNRVLSDSDLTNLGGNNG